MSHAPTGEPSLSPSEGWHCSHLYYRFNRAALKTLTAAELDEGRRQFAMVLDPLAPMAPARLQTSAVSGHKADLGLMVLDANPLVIDSVHQRLMSGPLGVALEPTYSFVSLTEVSEYVPTVEQYGQRLVAEGEDASGPAYAAKLKAYESREVMMREQRLHPDFPSWPSTCFYPMNKKRKVGENWFTLDFAARSKLMAEHGRTGMTFGGVGRHAVGPQPGVSERDRLQDALRRGQRPLCRVRAVLHELRDDAGSVAGALPGVGL